MHRLISRDATSHLNETWHTYSTREWTQLNRFSKSEQKVIA